jgi:glycosyltransferase involved in cell wall biosynthesis
MWWIDRFKATDKLVARTRLGLPLHKKLVLFGADSLGNKRKGGLHLEAALNTLKQQRIGQEVEVILFGSSSATLPLPAHPMGYISDDRQLALVYSAADAFVSPSDEDSGPMTVGEAMMCGTPVVAFKVGIAMEMITHRQTGFLVDRGSTVGLADGLRWALDADDSTRLRRGLRCRTFAVKFHDPATAARRHVKVYEEALAHVR